MEATAAATVPLFHIRITEISAPTTGTGRRQVGSGSVQIDLVGIGSVFSPFLPDLLWPTVH